MSQRNCPHCGAPRIATSKVPKDVVVVLPCPACRELCVMFRSKLIPLSWKIIKHGTREERKQHLAEVISEFIDPILADFPNILEGEAPDEQAELEEPVEDDSEAGPITAEEVDYFLHTGLKQIDNTAYFKKHIG